jgi:hypothetical protein
MHDIKAVRIAAENMAHDLTMQATALLTMAARIRGDYPSMPMSAEFQAFDIMHADLATRIIPYRAILGDK